MKMVQINGFQMAFEDHGKGIPLLLIHGYPLHHKIWEPQIQQLSRVARVIAPDLRGHGASDPLPGSYSITFHADDCAALLDHLQIKRPIIICGLSMGGYISMAFCRQYAARLAGIILVSTRARADSPEEKKNRELAASQVQTTGVGSIVSSMLTKLLSPQTIKDHPPLKKQLEEIMKNISPETVVSDLHGMMDRPDSLDTLRRVSLPALLIHGREDALIPLEEVQVMQAAMENSRLHVISAAGHLPNLEQSVQFNQIIHTYLEGFPHV